MRNTLLLLLYLCAITTLHAQFPLPQKLRIAEAHCAAPCGYSKGFHDLYYDEYLEYNLETEEFRYKRKAKKEYKNITIGERTIFSSPSLYHSLDSLFEHYEGYQHGGGKYFMYRIELIYCKDPAGLPSKSKVIDFIYTTSPEQVLPEFMKVLLHEYEEIISEVSTSIIYR